MIVFKYFLPLAVVYALPFILWQGDYFSLAGVVFLFIIMPALDWFLGRDLPQRNKKTIKLVHFIPYLYLPAHIALVVGGIAVSANIQLNDPWLYTLGLSTGVVTGAIGITHAHELGHRSIGWERFLAFVLMSFVGYGHFIIAHNKGHHRWAATPNDPASAPMGMSLFRFLPRTIIGSYISAWHIETKSTEHTLKNKVVHTTLWTFLFVGGAWSISLSALVFFVLQSVTAILLLETVNYIQHYGLQRKARADGSFEKIGPEHSWNTPLAANNYVLLQLGLHSYHHLHAKTGFQKLSWNKTWPQQPYGYALMILMAFFPPIWFRTMDKRATQYSSLVK